MGKQLKYYLKDPAANYAKDCLNKATLILNEDSKCMLLYGSSYTKSLGRSKLLLYVEWLRFKADVSIALFRLRKDMDEI